jgi:hypothetical protein
MKLLTVNEAATIKNCSRQAIWAAIKGGKLASVTVEVPATRIPADALASFRVDRQAQKAGKARNEAQSS